MSRVIEKKGRADAIDAYVGHRVKERRSALGLTQEKLADALDITFQQVQKYESGSNRLAASRLFRLSQVLNVPIDYFYQGLKGHKSKLYAGLADDKVDGYDAGTMAFSSEAEELFKAFCQISKPEVRQQIIQLAKTLAKSEPKSK